MGSPGPFLFGCFVVLFVSSLKGEDCRLPPPDVTVFNIYVPFLSVQFLFFFLYYLIVHRPICTTLKCVLQLHEMNMVTLSLVVFAASLSSIISFMPPLLNYCRFCAVVYMNLK